MPNGKDHLLPAYGPCDEAIEFVIRPPFGKERLREDDNAKATAGESFVYFPPEAIADLELKFIVPNTLTRLIAEMPRTD
jgi:hypothetical protein